MLQLDHSCLCALLKHVTVCVLILSRQGYNLIHVLEYLLFTLKHELVTDPLQPGCTAGLGLLLYVKIFVETAIFQAARHDVELIAVRTQFSLVQEQHACKAVLSMLSFIL